MEKKSTGVILLNMGGPDKLKDVKPFLFNLFSDREIIRLGPPLLQKPLAWYISHKRAPKSMKTYALIGGGSPLEKITQRQAKALEKALAQTGDFTVVTAMRYWHPNAIRALDELARQGITKVIALPLYPHYSKATSGSSISDLKRAISHHPHDFDLLEIQSWPDHHLYIRCLAENIITGLKHFAGEPTQIVYSAHSLPVSFIQEGDPYVDHLQLTIRLIEKQTNKKGLLCFQSRSGPVEWLAPSTPKTIDNLAKSGCKNILMVPISFVSDHIETLYEINMLYREQAENLGMRLEPTKSLNTNPLFIQCLRELVTQAKG